MLRNSFKRIKYSKRGNLSLESNRRRRHHRKIGFSTRSSPTTNVTRLKFKLINLYIWHNIETSSVDRTFI